MNQVGDFASSGARPTTRTLLVVSFPHNRERPSEIGGSNCGEQLPEHG